MQTSIATLIAVVGLWPSLAFVCCSGGSLDTRPHQVTYHVAGTTGSASVTYSNGNGNTEQRSAVRVPWQYPITARGGDFLYISAQNQEEFGGVTTWIEVDGKAYQQTTSQGGFVIATSSMRCCP